MAARAKGKKGNDEKKCVIMRGASAENGNADCRGRIVITNSPIVPSHL